MKKLIPLFIGGVLFAQSAQDIMYKVHNRPTWKSMKSKLELILVPKKGRERIYKMESYSKKNEKDETRMLIKFIYPSDIKGTKFLLIEHENADDDMWIYLPALRKAKRISAGGKSGAFMGSDFSNYDIGGGEYEDWNYKLLREDTLDGNPVWVIECMAKSKKIIKKTGYSKVTKWVRKDNYVVILSEHYDKSGKLKKRIKIDRVEKIDDIWFETEMTAENLETGHKSKFVFSDIKTNVKIPEKYFKSSYLER
jgi:outer membrane lipoprotein-sorting protein